MAFEAVPEFSVFDVAVPENPFSDGGQWSAGYWLRPPLMGGGPGGASVHGTVEFAVNGMYYLPRRFSEPIVEVYGCRDESGLGAALESHRIALYLDPENLASGYSSGYGGGISQSYFFRRYSFNGDQIGIGDVPASTDASPEKLGLRITPERVEQWGQISGVWTLITYAADTLYRGAFYLALETEEQGGINEVGWTCVGAVGKNRTQIYRILNRTQDTAREVV